MSGELGRGVPAAMGQVHPVLARGAGQGLCIILFAPHDDMFLGPSLYLGVLGMLLADGSLDEIMQSLTAGCPVQAQGALWPFLRAVGGGLRLFPTLARVRCSLGQKPSPGLDGPLHRPPGRGVGWWWGSGSLTGLGGGGCLAPSALALMACLGPCPFFRCLDSHTHFFSRKGGSCPSVGFYYYCPSLPQSKSREDMASHPPFPG